MIEAALYQKLLSISAATYPLVAPSNYDTPAIVYNRIGLDPTRDLSDDLQTEGYVDFQIDTYSPRFLEAKQTARQVRTMLLAWRDELVRSVTWQNELHWSDDTTDVSLFRVTLQLRFYTREL